MSRRHKKKKKVDFFDNYDYSQLSSSQSICKHFGECGGCRFQDIVYSSQIKLKEDYLKNLFGDDIKVTSASNQLNYRNRMDFVYAFNKLGLRKKGDFQTVIDIDECHLIPKEFLDSFQKIKQKLFDLKIDSYDFLEHKGFLRYVTFRFAPSTKELMIIFTSTTPYDEDQKKQFFELLDFTSKIAKSVYWLINDSLTDTSIPFVEPAKIIGDEYITEILGDTKLFISPFSFFQANSVMSEKMFSVIKENVSGETVDLCCGVGSIALFVSDNAKSVTGIEEVKASIDLANKNKKLNNDSKTIFFASPMKKILDFVPMNVDTLIVDPPRAGLERKMVEKILSIQPEKIIYMSCNPKTQKLDIDMLTKDEDYVLKSIEGYDMFPNTPHLETLAVLRRI